MLFIPSRWVTVGSRGVGWEAVSAFEKDLTPRRVAKHRALRATKQGANEALVSASLPCKHQVGEPERSLGLTVGVAMKHVFVEPSRRFKAVVIDGKVCRNQWEDLKRASAHRQVNHIEVVPWNVQRRPCL